MEAARRFICLASVVAVGCATEPPTSGLRYPEFELRQTLTGLIVSEWAPMILQDTDDGALSPWGEPENGDGSADFITRFDYDGNWDAGDNVGVLSLVSTGTGAIAGVRLGAYAMHRRPGTVGMVAGTAAAVLLGLTAGDAGSEDRSERATGWLAWAHVLTVPAAALGSHLRF